jgi:hypothetical protein
MCTNASPSRSLSVSAIAVSPQTYDEPMSRVKAFARHDPCCVQILRVSPYVEVAYIAPCARFHVLRGLVLYQ